MTPTPSSSGSGGSPEAANKIVRKRNRIPLSCHPCRIRKLKCNRSHPCENCIKRNDVESCNFATVNNSKGRRNGNNSSNGNDDMQNRIDRLEGLVLTLMAGGQAPAGANGIPLTQRSSIDSGDSSDFRRTSSSGFSPDVDTTIKEESDEELETVRSALGVMKVDKNKSYYRGETHWTTLLSEIGEVKAYFAATKAQYEKDVAELKAQNPETTGFPFSASRPPSRDEIISLAFNQGRPKMDSFIDRYFLVFHHSYHILHGPTFQKQYEEFWADSSKADLTWVACMYCMVCLAFHSHDASEDGPPEFEGRLAQMATMFRGGAEQALIVGDYQKSMKFTTIQSLLLLCICQKRTLALDGSESTWLMIASVIRSAISMGLHRDPKPFANISPFEAEMRRRVWSSLTCTDILTSISLGLPFMIREDICDTSLPLNIHDHELQENMRELPETRGTHEYTGVSYLIAETRLVKVFGQIVTQANRFDQRLSYDEIIRIDNEARETLDSCPPLLRMRPMEQASNDPPWLIIQRFKLDMMYRKAMLVLHRPYTSRARSNPRYSPSRRACVEAAITLLGHMAVLFDAQKTKLRQSRWYIQAMPHSDFLHASAIICLELVHTAREITEQQNQQQAQHNGSNATSPVTTNRPFWTQQERQEMMSTLERTQLVYADLVSSYTITKLEVRKTLGIITVMIDKLRGRAPDFPMSAPPCSGSNLPPNKESDPTRLVSPEHSAAMTLGLMSSTGSAGGETQRSTPGPGLFTPISEMARTSTPGGNMIMGDASGQEQQAGLLALSGLLPAYNQNANPNTGLSPFVPFPGLSGFSPGQSGGLNVPPTNNTNGADGGANSGMEMPSGLDWDEWDSFMQGISSPSNQPWSLLEFPTSPQPLGNTAGFVNPTTTGMQNGPLNATTATDLFGGVTGETIPRGGESGATQPQ